MSDFDRQENNKKPADDGSTVEATNFKKAIGNWSVISTVVAMVTRIFFGLRIVGVGYSVSFHRPREAWSNGEKTYRING